MAAEEFGKTAQGASRPADAPGTVAVRAGHRFDVLALTRFLERQCPGFAGPVAARQFEGGQSNPTFHLSAASGEYVLRKKPPGTLLPTAHAIDREYRLLVALADSDVPVPRAHLYCDDAAVIGTPFYLMDYVPGRMFSGPTLPGIAAPERAAIYDAMNATLAALHAFDWASAGLGDFGKPAGYVERQVARWSKQYAAAKLSEVPAMEHLREWLSTHVPKEELTAIVHGDFRTANLIFHPDQPRVIAVLDWELATLGHPFADLAYNCLNYHLPAWDANDGGFADMDFVALGIPAQSDYVAAYSRRSGRDASRDFAFFLAFSLFRTAAIQQGIYARALAGNASSARAKKFGEMFPKVARIGWEMVAGSAAG